MAYQPRSVKIRALLGLSQAEFAKKYGIPKRTIEDWDRGTRNPPKYVLDLLERVVEEDAKLQIPELYADRRLRKGVRVNVTLNGRTYSRVVQEELTEPDEFFGTRNLVCYVVINNKKYYDYDIDIVKPAK